MSELTSYSIDELLEFHRQESMRSGLSLTVNNGELIVEIEEEIKKRVDIRKEK